MNIPILRIPYTEEDLEFIKNGIEKVLKSGYLTMADNVAKFEEQFAEFIGVRYAVAVNSGTSSLEIVLRAIGVEGSTVIMPSNTYMATPIAAIHAGGKVIFTECQRENLQMSPDDLERKIRPDTKAVILVHIGGIISPYFDAIKKICEDNNLFLLEDAAHGHGATIDGRKAGSLGIAGSFSFYPTKVLVAAEGGMITTNDKDLYEKALILREHGKADHSFNVHTEFGYNWRFSELHAVLALQQMRKADWILADRRRIARTYDERLHGVKGIKLVKIPDNIKSAYYKYILYLEDNIDRDLLKKMLKKEYNISLTGEVYAHPCHLQPVFQKYPGTMANNNQDSFPETEYACKHHICLPLYPGLTEEEIDYVVRSLKKVLA